MSDINKNTIERLLSDNGASQTALAAAVAGLDACGKDESKKKAYYKDLVARVGGGAKKAVQTKAKIDPQDSKDWERAREADGTYKADDPSTPDVNESRKPKKRKAKARKSKS